MSATMDAAPTPHTTKTRRLTAAGIGLVLAASILFAGWFVPLRDYITPRSGVGYTLGIIGGSLMLALLIYPARKRLPFLSALGSPRFWFRIHMALGIAGPLCILYHCGYRLGAANSNVALISMLVVAGSGLIGRYLYARIHHGLYGQKATLAELRTVAERLKAETSGAARLMPQFASRLDAAEARINRGVPLVPKALAALILFLYGRASLRHHVRATLKTAAAESVAIADQRKNLAIAADRYADSRLTAARRVAEFESCEQLFSLWHVLHLPLFGMLLVAGIVHVIAVNVY